MERLKQHLKEHKEAYIVGATALSVGLLAGITGAIVKGSRTTLLGGVDSPVKESTGPFISAKSLFGSASNEVVTTIHRESKGNPGFVTQCIETGELFETQGTAAKTYNIPEAIMSLHLNKGYDLTEGLHFKRLGILA